MAPKFRRKRLWIDPPFQARLLLRMGLYLLLYVAFVWHVGFVFQAMREVATGGIGQGIGRFYLDYCQRQTSLLLALVLILPPVLYDLLKFSHRIAGPLFRCRRVMQQMAAGEPVPEFTPRKHDQMREFFQTFNALIKVWNDRLGAEGRSAGESAAETKVEEVSPRPENEAVAP